VVRSEPAWNSQAFRNFNLAETLRFSKMNHDDSEKMDERQTRSGVVEICVEDASMSHRPFKWVLLAVLAISPLGHGFGAEWPDPPSRQPSQMWSKVNYDSKMDDPFFKSNKWSYWYGGKHVVEGMTPEGEQPQRLKHTAKCFSTSFGGKHRVRFCEARLLDIDKMDLFIHELNPAFCDRLRVRIRNGMFSCQFWTVYKQGGTIDLIWTTKRQKLILDKKAYRKGDVVKGRIDFECLDELTNPNHSDRPPRTIIVYGVFKAIVE
jgi:hypothetical protein